MLVVFYVVKVNFGQIYMFQIISIHLSDYGLTKALYTGKLLSRGSTIFRITYGIS